MGYLIEFPLAEDGFDENIKEVIEEIFYKRGIFGPARTRESRVNTTPQCGSKSNSLISS